MSEPLESRLARLSPAAPKLDRDELLFRAGRASARAGRGWKVAVALLAATNAATLLWPSPAAPTPAVVPVAVPAPVEAPASEPHPASYLALSRQWELPPPAAPAGGGADKPLTAGSRWDVN